MPNEPRKETGRPLRSRIDKAVQLTAEQQASRSREGARREHGHVKDAKPVPKTRRAPQELQKVSVEKKHQKQQKPTSRHHEARMPDAADGKGRVSSKAEGSHRGLILRGKARIVAIAACVVLLGGVILYPVGRTYYQSLRQEQQLQAEYDAINARNQQIQNQNNALNTDEGVENQARKELGWVKKGEKAAVVTNAGDTDTSTELPDQVATDDVQAPQTWYYDFLDVIFFVQ